EEEGDGGGPNYTVYLRDTDGSPPARIGEGVAMAISPDTKWAITRRAKGGPLNLVPTGAGETRQLTHDAVTYDGAQFFPDGKHLLAYGIETGHGGRDYVIDLSNGDSKAVTPEGMGGVQLSPDGKSVAVRAADGKRGIWSLEKSDFRPIPGLESKDYVIGWTQDGQSVYVAPLKRGAKAVQVSRANIQTGKMEPWKSFGAGVGAQGASLAPPHLSSDGSAYAYLYVRTLSEAYVVSGLK
ncbi:MAG: WD40 repeat domain-containing protein, partial [Candidatus Sulfotelmatobacter sp.]